ncbi:MAG: hypothetical protein J2O46_00720 [Nocardioides sp.]|nr:hypothetical protein [Nocardioides sp.]
MQRLRVTSLDEAFINLASDTVMSVDVELALTGRIDIERLFQALRAASASHPIARARLAAPGITTTALTWAIPDEPDHLAVEVTDEPVEVVRDRLLSVQHDLAYGPVLCLALVREADGDRLLFNFHHAAFDGMGAMRFIASVARAYVGGDDPIGGPPVKEARDLRKLVGARGAGDVRLRAAKLAKDAARRGRQLAKVAPDKGVDDGRRYAVARLRISAVELAEANMHRPEGATLNDLVLAAHALTIVRWNREHGRPLGDRVSIMMPVNMRPAEWSREVVSNFASYVAVFVPTSVTTLSDAVTIVHKETTAVKQDGTAAWIVDVLEPGNLVPHALKKALPTFLPLVERQFVETTTLSNLGRQAPPAWGDAGEVRELWFSPPSMSSTIPLALGVAGMGEELYVGLRSDRRSIGPEALQAYAELFRSTLLGRS